MNIFKKAATVLALSSLVYASPYELDVSHSEVGFSVKHMMISNVKGKFGVFDGSLDFDAQTKSFKALKAVMDADSIDTDNDRRDEHLRSKDFFDANEFDEVVFEMTSYKKISADEGLMSGKLSIKNITKPVKLKVEIGGLIKGFKGENRLGFTMSGKISRKAYGLTWNKVLEAGGVAVGDTVRLNIEIEAYENLKK